MRRVRQVHTETEPEIKVEKMGRVVRFRVSEEDCGEIRNVQSQLWEMRHFCLIVDELDGLECESRL